MNPPPPLDPDLRIFLIGLFGSLAVEVANIVRVYESGRQLSVRYKRPIYILCRFWLAIVGGVLAWIWTIDNATAFVVGAATPLIIQNLTRLPATSEGEEQR